MNISDHRLSFFLVSFCLALCSFTPGAENGANAVVFDRVVAMVNGEAVTLSETREAAWGLTGQPQALTSEHARDLADALAKVIDLRLMVQAAEAAGFQVDMDAVDRAAAELMEQFRRRFPTESDYLDFLHRSRLNPQTLASLIRKREIERRLVGMGVRQRVSLSGEEVQVFEKERQRRGEETVFYRFDQILIPLRPDANDTEVSRAYRRALEAVASAARGDDFKELAREYGSGAENASGSEIGWVARRDLRQGLLEALEKLETNQVSPPVRTNLGYHVLMLRARRDAGSLLFLEKMEEEQKRWIKELRSKADIRYFPYTPSSEKDQ